MCHCGRCSFYTPSVTERLTSLVADPYLFIKKNELRPRFEPLVLVPHRPVIPFALIPLGSDHIVSTPFETIAKKKNNNRDREGLLSTCDQQFIMSCQEHNPSWKGNASVLASMRWRKTRDVTSMTVPKKETTVIVHKLPAGDFSPLRF